MDIEKALNKIMKKFSKTDKIFNAERGFQLYLAVELINAGFKVELEENTATDDANRYVDIVAIKKGIKYPIELKYLTAKNDKLNLKNHGAQNHRSYDVIKDIYRIEQYKMGKGENVDYQIGTGYSIVITNDKSYFREYNDKDDDVDYGKFKIHNGREFTGKLDWNKVDSKSKANRSEIELNGKYTVNWKDYGTKGFKWCMFKITETGHGK